MRSHRNTLLVALLLAAPSVHAPALHAQSVAGTKSTMSVAMPSLTLSSDVDHGAAIVFTVTTGGAASNDRTLCRDVTLQVPVTRAQVACAAVAMGSKLRVLVDARTIDRCAGRSGNSLLLCQGSYSAAACMESRQRRSDSGCRYFGGFQRDMIVTVPTAGPNQTLRLTLADAGNALQWK